MDNSLANMPGDRIFQHSILCGSDRTAITLKAPINIEELKQIDVPELCARLLNYHRIPCFVEADMISTMQKYIENELNELKNKNSSSCIHFIRKDPDVAMKLTKSIAEKYKKTCIEYAQAVDDNVNEFPLAYHYLIHSAAMQIVLKLEAKYHSSLAKLIVNREQSLVKMQERQQLEMARMCENVGFAFSNQDVTNLASKHLDDTERLMSHWENESANTIVRQRGEFRQVLVDLHREMKKNNHRINDSGPAYNRVKQIIDENVTIIGLHSRNAKSGDEDSVSQLSSNMGSQNGSSGILMEESFTINLGAQLKTMHNVRLVVTDMLGFCHYFDEREREAQRFQTAMSLYSNSLSALVLFTDKRLGYKTGLQKEFSKICHSSTEFHFDSLADQLSKIQKTVAEKRRGIQQKDSTESQEEGYLHLEEGDFYITKHSNLSQVHVVFHLVADESSLQTKASLSSISSRHPVIISLRQILKICSSHDIGHITIPLLLTHELTEEITFQWCVKRAELVMKCVKGFMMEMATWDGGVSRTMQFVVPPGISEEAFDRMRSTLPEVFRTTSTRDLTRTRPSR